MLKLVLTHKWYDMIESGEKREEYREITEYWMGRLLYRIQLPFGGYWSAKKDILAGNYECIDWKSFTGGAPVFNKFTHVQFQRAYPKNPPRMVKEIEEITIGTGRPEWGAEPGKLYFVIKLK